MLLCPKQALGYPKCYPQCGGNQTQMTLTVFRGGIRMRRIGGAHSWRRYYIGTAGRVFTKEAFQPGDYLFKCHSLGAASDKLQQAQACLLHGIAPPPERLAHYVGSLPHQSQDTLPHIFAGKDVCPQRPIAYYKQ
jgi:hypothetical protein